MLTETFLMFDSNGMSGKVLLSSVLVEMFQRAVRVHLWFQFQAFVFFFTKFNTVNRLVTTKSLKQSFLSTRIELEYGSRDPKSGEMSS